MQVAGVSRRTAALLPVIGARNSLFTHNRLGLQTRGAHSDPDPRGPKDADNAGHAPEQPVPGQSPPPPRGTKNAQTSGGAPASGNRFIQKLSELEGLAAPGSPSTAGAARRRGCEEKVLKERRRMLVFRDVGMDLDKPILSRDVFLVFKYFRYGIEFAVDNELERMLRYFNEHALNELKIIQNSKLMRGPASLSRKKGHMGSGGGFSYVPPLFPPLRAANMRLFCTYTKETAQTVDDLMKASLQGVSFYRQTDVSALSSCKARYFCEQDSSQMTLFSSSAFRRPAVIIYSQLGQKLGAQADLEWRRLAYATIYPSLMQHIPVVDDTKSGSHVSLTSERCRGLRHCPKETSAGTVRTHVMPIDLISLRSMDVYKYRWVHRLYVRRFARSLVPSGRFLEHGADKAQVDGLLTACTTFVGSKLLQPFYSVLGLRNYLSPHVMLVDHEGMIRWLTAGFPDDYEKKHFPALLKQLEEEYYSARCR